AENSQIGRRKISHNSAKMRAKTTRLWLTLYAWWTKDGKILGSGGSVVKRGRCSTPRKVRRKNGPNAQRSGPMPSKNASQKLFRFFLANASEPQRPCDRMSMSARS